MQIKGFINSATLTMFGLSDKLIALLVEVDALHWKNIHENIMYFKAQQVPNRNVPTDWDMHIYTHVYVTGFSYGHLNDFVELPSHFTIYHNGLTSHVPEHVARRNFPYHAAHFIKEGNNVDTRTQRDILNDSEFEWLRHYDTSQPPVFPMPSGDSFGMY